MTDPSARSAAITRKIAALLHVHEAKVTPDATLESLGGDSLSVLVIAMEIEEDWGFTFGKGEIESFRTVADVLDAVAWHRKDRRHG